jgi:hypothetical protein
MIVGGPSTIALLDEYCTTATVYIS